MKKLALALALSIVSVTALPVEAGERQNTGTASPGGAQGCKGDIVQFNHDYYAGGPVSFGEAVSYQAKNTDGLNAKNGVDFYFHDASNAYCNTGGGPN
jgi:hypothetical protein